MNFKNFNLFIYYLYLGLKQNGKINSYSLLILSNKSKVYKYFNVIKISSYFPIFPRLISIISFSSELILAKPIV